MRPLATQTAQLLLALLMRASWPVVQAIDWELRRRNAAALPNWRRP